MRDTIQDIGIEKEQKGKKTIFLKFKKARPDSKVIEEMNKLGLKKQPKRKVILLWIE